MTETDSEAVDLMLEVSDSVITVSSWWMRRVGALDLLESSAEGFVSGFLTRVLVTGEN
jgi:hypothetical protein